MNKLYFIIPVYKVEKYLVRCVNSVLNQSYINTEIILVDDGSPDNCPAICDELSEKHKNITVIHKPNGGLSDARNAGLDIVLKKADETDFLTFLDSDDFVHETYAEKMISACRDFSCGIAQCNYEKGDSDTFTAAQAENEVYSSDYTDALLGYDLKSQSCAKIYRVSVFKDVRFPLGVLNEDEFTTYRAVCNCEKVAFITENLYYYYQHGTSIMDEIAKKLKDNPHRYDYLKAYDERLEFFRNKNMPEQILKTHEKICTDIILRYCEQMRLNVEDRDTDCVSGEYIKNYKRNYKIMIKRKSMPLKRRLMYIAFFIFPYSAVLMSKIFTLRK